MKFKKIQKIKVIDSTSDVYDIQLEKNHYFKANTVYTHNCRLKNDVSDQMNDFSYSLGAGGVATGSISVMTINLNRAIQKATKNNIDPFDYVRSLTQDIHKYQTAYRHIIQRYKDSGMLPVYDAQFIDLDKQFLTVGVNGLVEAAEFLGFEISNNDAYLEWAGKLLGTISDENKIAANRTGFKFNTEMIPGENVGKKFADWDKKDNLVVPRDVYNSYMYIVEDNSVTELDKFGMHGSKVMQHLDGGSAYHCNLEEYPTKEGFKKLLRVAANEGCEYFCFNVAITICNNCNNIDKRTLDVCPECGSVDLDYATRVIGYLKRVSSFSIARQKEHDLRYYHKKGI